MNEQAQHRRAPVRAGQTLAQQSTGQHVRLWVGDDEKRQSGDDADDELLLLLFAVAAAAAILEQCHFNICVEKFYFQDKVPVVYVYVLLTF